MSAVSQDRRVWLLEDVRCEMKRGRIRTFLRLVSVLALALPIVAACARLSDADSSTERGNSDSGSDAGCCEQSDASSSHNADW